MKARVVITDKIVNDALAEQRPVSEVLGRVYAGEIADRVKADDRLRGYDPFQFAMMDAGITKHSKVKDMYTTEGGANEWLFPVYVDRKLHESIQDMNILQYLVTTVRYVEGLSARGAKLIMDEENKDATRLKRVAEATDLPLATIKLSDVSTTLYKRGRAVQASYETLMYMTVDMFSKHLDMIANDVSGQQVGDALVTLVEGDGNKNAAPVSVMDGTEMSMQELAKFAIEFWKDAKVPLDTVVCGDGKFFQALLTMTFKVDEINGMLQGSTFNFPQAMLKDLTVLYDARVPSGGSNKEQLIGLNRQHALLKDIANGSQIREIAKNIQNQTNLGTISEIANFEKSLDKGSRILRAK